VALREESGGELPPDDPKVAQAVFGREVEIFIDEHPVAKYVIDRAREDLEKAHIALVEIDPTDAPGIAALQLDARVASRVRGWLGEAIEQGRQAGVLLQQERDEHG
jgi:hypothetical protein